tara:strand:+ start:2710 stop:3042 length:333 start_codon:yes stop_codon:yes gene_type:complete
MAQDNRVCNSCGGALNEDSKFCPACGTNVEIPSDVDCPSCGEKNAPDSKYCDKCGTSLEKSNGTDIEDSGSLIPNWDDLTFSKVLLGLGWVGLFVVFALWDKIKLWLGYN